jgi:3,4-dehydroadipyl-CoA semialdehyde dehydrogenase
MTLKNLIGGKWVSGQGDGEELVDPVLGQEVARVSVDGLSYGDALAYARQVGGPALRALSYDERATLLGRIAEVLAANKNDYYRIALENMGATRGDAAFDVDGAIFTLRYYAKAGAALGNVRVLRSGDVAPLSRDGAFQAVHLSLPLSGAAILINAFNFPAWGLWEKAAVALLSGVPVLAKPATATAWLAQRMVEDVDREQVLPAGALSVMCGPAGDLLEHVTLGDVVAFTGSAETAARVRTAPTVVKHSTRVNIEADSLNVALMGPDAAEGSAEFDLLVSEVVSEMTVKAGQKCTAIRRILVPAHQYAAVAEAIASRLSKIIVGNPRNPEVKMGPLISKAQQRAVHNGIAQLAREAPVICGGNGSFKPVDADPGSAAFIPPTLLGCADPAGAIAVHEVEVFGPVATLLPYRDVGEALQLAARGGGSLVASVFTADRQVMQTVTLGLASTHGRVHLVNAAVGKSHTGHGNVMPMSIHGGPGRAGGGQELGGLRGLHLYHQLVVVQGPSDYVGEALSS